MTVYSQATDLLVRLGTFSEGALEETLGARGQSIVEQLTAASDTLQAVAELRNSIQDSGAPRVSADLISEKAEPFRNRLAEGIDTLQLPITDELLQTIDGQKALAERWAKSIWNSYFDCGDLLDRAQHSGLGSAAMAAKKAEREIRQLKGHSPVLQQAEINKALNCNDPSGWKDKIASHITKLEAAVEKVEAEKNQYPKQVQEFLTAVAGDGFPLSKVTPELLKQIKAAGLIEGFVVDYPRQ